jgi:hypothetical protein
MFVPMDVQQPIVRDIGGYPEIAHSYANSDFAFSIPFKPAKEQLRRQQDNSFTITETDPVESYCILNEDGIRDSKTHENIVSDEDWQLPFREQPENIFALQFQDETSTNLIFFLDTGCLVKDSEGNDIVLPPISLGSVSYDQYGTAGDFVKKSFLSNITNLLDRKLKGSDVENVTVLHMRVEPFEEGKIITFDAYIEETSELNEDGIEELVNQPVVEILSEDDELLEGQEINILEPSNLTEIIESLLASISNETHA